VVNILTKQREPLEGLEISCTGEQAEEPPYQFTKIHLHFAVKGPVNAKKVEKAIQLSEEKYCSVTNTLKQGVEITHDFEIVE
jgi:putative redox protein